MKYLLLPSSLLICFICFVLDCSAQKASSQIAYKTKPTEKNHSTASQGKLVVAVTQSAGNKFNIVLQIENKEEGRFTIKLKSATSLLHQEYVVHKTYTRKYDMYNLPAGNYEVEVNNGKEVFTQKIAIKTNNSVRVLSLL